MADINKWLGYLSISVVMIVGILVATGMVGALNLKSRMLVGILVFFYAIFRIFTLYSRHQKADRETRSGGRTDIGREDNSNPNNT